MDEFELIKKFFDLNKMDSGVVIGIGDDGAVLEPNINKQQVQVIDTLVENIHFPSAIDPADIAYRAVMANLSDIAAMGAIPRWMTLSLTINNKNDKWIESFSKGLFEAAEHYRVSLVGGDLNFAENISVTISISGEVSPSQALLRNGAQIGDSLYVTGTIGDAAGGLELLKKNKPNNELTQRFLRPTPRIKIGRELIGKATAAIDISDGLLGDLKKILVDRNLGVDIQLDLLPISEALSNQFNSHRCYSFALNGGDDYELCFTAKDEDVSNISGITKVGSLNDSGIILCYLQDNIYKFEDESYRHFK
ncbi:MAG: thiamine-phosphate kinase [Woeseia sp.]|nr:thiamine-phosphate kinase [Woeseia sp.]|tara:strand:- start:1144 stop:2064 length:921 start_codon:yes stop_codon:yes gene_type:complete